jgi:Dyp-type peroxidase family
MAGARRAADSRRARAIVEPLLDVHDIQGNCLAGFNKDHQQLIALTIRNSADARQWLVRIHPEISSLAEVYQFNNLFRAMRKRRGHDPAGLVATWMNIAFSRDGIEKLTSLNEAAALPDEAFQIGLGKERSQLLRDPVRAGETDPTAHWVVGGTGRVPDILMIVASDNVDMLKSACARLIPLAADGAAAPQIVWEELGETRRDYPGREHFGYKDGISQPGIRGLVSSNPKVPLTRRLLRNPTDGTPEFAKPGQPLVWPGQFVLGYPSGDPQSGLQLEPQRLGHSWFKNGSFLVFRRLTQNVAGFHAFLTKTAAELSKQPGFEELQAVQLGSMLVGRWPTGAPISRSPTNDDAALAEDELSNNDFLFDVDTPVPRFLPSANARPGSFPRAMEASNGPICPHAAHVLKTNPRDLPTDLGNPFDTLTRRILRRGIPFGPPLDNPANGDDGIERGLHFLCYQASIKDQFELLQTDWANNSGPPAGGGHDFIIGQTSDLKRTAELPPTVPDHQGGPITAPTQWVVPTGGAYLFSPSISAIRDVLGVQS